MQSREILPIEDRLTHSQLLYNNIENGNKIHFYHFALEAAERQIEQLQEDNKRLKELFKDCWKTGEIEGDYKACVTLSKCATVPTNPGKFHGITFEEWLEENNIKL